MHRCQFYQLAAVVVVRGFISAERTAFAALVSDYKSALCVRLCRNWIHHSAAVGSTVSRIYIKMERAETFRTVVARGVSERRNFKTAVFANEGFVIFCKSFCFHRSTPITGSIILFSVNNLPRSVKNIAVEIIHERI